ncbi:MAG: tetratricopeptide repeat protein [Planctomycetota bacterium]|nr:tetratricopeptide repeat protein [Planctomycetota bacterium]
MSRSAFSCRNRIGCACIGLILLWTSPGASGQDPTPPQTPQQFTRKSELKLTYTANEASLSRIRLWTTWDRGRTWKIEKEQTGPFPGYFLYRPDRDGVFGFRAQSIDLANNSEAAPISGVTPPIALIVVDRTPPSPRLFKPLENSQVLGGRSYSVWWEVRDAYLSEKPVTIKLRVGESGTWESVPGGPFPPRGKAAVELPDLHSPAEIEITCSDRAGNRARLLRRFNIIPLHDPSNPQASTSPDNKLLRAQEYCREGQRFFREGRYENAVASYQKALDIEPQLAVAIHDLGVVHFHRADYVQAFSYLQKARKLKPKNAKFSLYLGRAYFKMNRLQQALQEFESSLDHAQNEYQKAEALWDAARVFQRLGRGPEARRRWRRIIEIGNNPRAVPARYELEKASK